MELTPTSGALPGIDPASAPSATRRSEEDGAFVALLAAAAGLVPATAPPAGAQPELVGEPADGTPTDRPSAAAGAIGSLAQPVSAPDPTGTTVADAPVPSDDTRQDEHGIGPLAPPVSATEQAPGRPAPVAILDRPATAGGVEPLGTVGQEPAHDLDGSATTDASHSPVGPTDRTAAGPDAAVDPGPRTADAGFSDPSDHGPATADPICPEPILATVRPRPAPPVESPTTPLPLAAPPAVLLAEPGPVAEPATTAIADPAWGVAEQLAVEVRRVDLGTDGSSEVTVQLDPVELGQVDLRVRVADGVVHVHVEAARDDTAHLLRQALADLRAALEDAGLVTGSLVSGSAWRDPSERTDRGRRDDGGPLPSSDPSLPARPVTRPVPLARAVVPGRVDLTL